MPRPVSLERQGLWTAIVDRTASARACGALVPLETDGVELEDGGLRFLVRVARNLARKAVSAGPPGVDPFDPPEEALTLGALGPHHLAVLNKFNVVDHHLLLVTRRWADQDELLDADDFRALWACLEQVDGLGFYNGGRDAGASQRHKHLQLVPTPVGAARSRTAIDDAVRRGALPFPGWVAAFTADPLAAHASYLALMASCGAPYNFLVTRDFMLLVPRLREHARGISVNTLGFAGSFFVRDEAALAVVREAGPLALLNEVCRQGRSSAADAR